jgi:hypothetical protein
MGEEIILAFPDPVPRLRNVRSTLFLGGHATLVAAGYGEAYTAAAPREVHDTLASTVAGMWVPIDIVLAHYAAVDSLGISAETAAKLGRGTFDRTKGMLLGTAVGLAKGAGVTPWTLLPHFQRFWLRGNDGGGVRVISLGPKEARIDLVEVPHVKSPYFRNACRGLCTVLLEMVSRKTYVHEMARRGPETSMSMKAQWV